MKKILVQLAGTLVLICTCHAMVSADSGASNSGGSNLGGSKRIEVYTISQSFWDVTPGETLGEIVIQLLPDNPAMRDQLKHDILQLNPNAFSQSNPDNLKANVRLWLPDNAPARQSNIDKNRYDVESFSWGQIYRPKQP